MTFLSVPFYAFWLVAIVAYQLLPQKGRPVWLLVTSWFFYLCAGAQYFPFLLGVIVLSYVAGLLMERKNPKTVVALSAILCFGLLFILKYLNFAIGLVTGVLAKLGLTVSSPALTLLLPAGISFYTFQAVGYLIDVYRGKVKPNRDFLHHALFLSFFPQVLSGPIPRAGELMPQLVHPPRATWNQFRGGLIRFLWGAFKKLVLADRLALLTATVFAAPETFGRLQLIMAAAAFSLQIYCDFSAYSDMALGVAQTMGITLMENFKAPYFARSIQEFWRRWHISLSSWFRDYLYIPLGGSRKGTARKWLNVLIVFAVSGLWHGAALTFVVWGLLNGLYQVMGGLTLPWRKKARTALHIKEDSRLLALFQMGITFLLATIAWVFFKAPSFSAAGALFTGILKNPWWAFIPTGWTKWDAVVAVVGVVILTVCDWLDQRKTLSDRWLNAKLPTRWVLALGLLVVVVILGCYGPGYNAQDFIYFNF